MAQQDLWDKFWKDKDGEVVVYQHPNALLIAWLALTLASLFTTGTLADILWYVALAILAACGLLEIAKGVNYLRRAFGVFVLLLVVVAALRLA